MRPRRPSPQEEASRRLAELDWWGSEVPPARRTEPPHGADEPSGEPAAPPPVPVPGRHAAPARRVRLVGGLVPESLRGRAAVGGPQLTVVALLVAAGLAVTAWLVVRSDPEPGGEVLAAGASAAPLVPLSTDADPSSAGAARQAGRITVDVEGRVRRPGIAVLDAGARVVDALKAAGGPKRGADTSGLNLARVLVDGEQILVDVDPPPAAAAAGPSGGAGAAPGQLVNLNTATLAELETLPEVGPVTAEAIIAWRDQHGGFTSVDELLEVDGIGDKTLETIAPHVTV